ncbi:MAG TPA: AmmeMemoRadiSam system radical SAM enzyme [Bacteroidales bacterium]|nr:AmmeMemoRadiSam system radical SAM enzyme [Bacteroidales bacterium]
MKEALFYEKRNDQKVKCHLCPHNCIIRDQKRGVCGVRKNKGGILYSENYGEITGLGFDPIEKKPLYHFHPGRNILSIGSIGCNLKCFFCQNWEISQATIDDIPRRQTQQVEDIIKLAEKKTDNLGIAYTYNEPTIYYEFMLDVARELKAKGLKNVMVTNGYINKEPLEKLIPYMDAFSIDLKGFTEEFYRKNTSSSLESIMESILQIGKSDSFLEITNLVIPGLNDQIGKFQEMLEWITTNLGENTILHISRYYPGFKSHIQPTSVSKLKEFYTLAKEHLNYVYLGNVMLEDGSSTYCHQCANLLVKRNGYDTQTPGLDEAGKCIHCENKVFVR